MKKTFVGIGLLFITVLTSCEEGKFNIFSVDQDIEMGEEVVDQILQDPKSYPILPRESNKEAYAYVNKIKDKLLKSGKIKYADKFNWDIHIIDQDVLNAFAVPGGTTFYYTGLLKYLDDEASLAGIMAHEFAHADKRHSTTILTKQYGFQTLLGMLLGEDSNIAVSIAQELALGLGSLKFSRDNEYEADESAVKYLYETDYDARGVAYFFEKLLDAEGSSSLPTPVWLSTHPNEEDRVERIYKTHTKLGGKQGKRFESDYTSFKNLLK